MANKTSALLSEQYDLLQDDPFLHEVPCIPDDSTSLAVQAIYIDHFPFEECHLVQVSIFTTLEEVALLLGSPGTFLLLKACDLT